jgi:hypothetical protein
MSIQTWDQLAKAFIDQFSYNLDLAPTRADLEALSQLPSEPFKDYIRRWRSLATQLPNQLPLDESIDLVIQKAHPSLEALLSFQTFKSFTDLIRVGTRIEARLLKGKCPLLTNLSQTSLNNANPCKDDNSDVPVIANISTFPQGQGRRSSTRNIHKADRNLPKVQHTPYPPSNHPLKKAHLHAQF